MRTTLAIDDDVLAAARHLAARQRTSIGDVISSLARQGLGVVTPHRTPAVRNGIPLLPRRNDEAAPVTLELVNQPARRTRLMVHLLDVNVLIALVDPAHVQHEQAHAWFADVGRHAFATCPLTENGLLRIVGNPKYPNTPGSPAVVMQALDAVRGLPGHAFWPDDISLADRGAVDASRLSGHAQITDSYLLALAKAHGGRLASLDRRLVVDAVPGGRDVLASI